MEEFLRLYEDKIRALIMAHLVFASVAITVLILAGVVWLASLILRAAKRNIGR
jgi:hypothetical protein